MKIKMMESFKMFHKISRLKIILAFVVFLSACSKKIDEQVFDEAVGCIYTNMLSMGEMPQDRDMERYTEEIFDQSVDRCEHAMNPLRVSVARLLGVGNKKSNDFQNMGLSEEEKTLVNENLETVIFSYILPTHIRYLEKQKK